MFKKIKGNKIESFFLFLIITFGFFLRLIPAMKLEIWFDEAYTFFAREQTFFGLINFEPVHPPLFYWLIKCWSQLKTTVFFLRIPSLIFSIFNLIVIFLIAKTIKFNKYFPLLATFFFSFSVLNIEESFQIRMYALVLFLMLLSFWSYLKILFGQKEPGFYLFIFCLTNFLGILSDYAFIWYFLSLIVATFIFCLWQKRSIFGKQIIDLKYGLLTSSLLMSLWLGPFISNFQRGLRIMYKRPLFTNEIKGLFISNQIEFFRIEYVYFFILLFTSIVFGFFIIWMSFKEKKVKKFLFWLLINLFFYVPIFSAFLMKTFLNQTILPSRNLIIGTLFAIFSLSGLISYLFIKKNNGLKFLGLITLITIMSITFFSLKNTYLYREKTFFGAPSYKDAVEFIQSNTSFKKDTFVFLPSWEYLVFNYYFYGYGQNNFSFRDYEKKLYENVLSKEREKRNYLFVNFDFLIIKEGKNQELVNFLSNCLDYNHGLIFYKKAHFLRCSQ